MLVSSRTTNILLIAVLAVGIAIAGMFATDGRAGPLDPPAAPASTLPQVEPRSPIPPAGWDGTFPIVIDAPGSYFLTRNLDVPGGADGIAIPAAHVSLDLNGFRLSADTEGAGIGVVATGSHLHLSNGLVNRFGKGVETATAYTVVSGVRVTRFTVSGIKVGFESRVESCQVTAALSGAFAAVDLGGYSTMSDCEVDTIQGHGVYARNNSIVENSRIRAGKNPSGLIAASYAVYIFGPDVTVRNNHIQNYPEAELDVGVGGNGALIIDNVIHCYTSIVNLGAFSYYAPVDGQEHTNEERYAAGFC